MATTSHESKPFNRQNFVSIVSQQYFGRPTPLCPCGRQANTLLIQRCPVVHIACHVTPIAQMLIPAEVLDHSVPSASWMTNTATPPFTCTSKRGTTNGPEVDGQHPPVHSSHARFHAKVVTSLWQQVGRPRFEAVFGMPHQYC